MKKPTAKLTETSSEFYELHKLGGNYGATVQMNTIVLKKPTAKLTERLLESFANSISLEETTVLLFK